MHGRGYMEQYGNIITPENFLQIGPVGLANGSSLEEHLNSWSTICLEEVV